MKKKLTTVILVALALAVYSTPASFAADPEKTEPPYTGTWFFQGEDVLIVAGANRVAEIYLPQEQNEVNPKVAYFTEKNGAYVLQDGDDMRYEVTVDGDLMTVKVDGEIHIATRVHYDPRFVGTWTSTEFSGTVNEQFRRLDLDLTANGKFFLTAEGEAAGAPLKGAYLTEGKVIQLKQKPEFIKSIRYDSGSIRLAIGDGAVVLRQKGHTAEQHDTAVEQEHASESSEGRRVTLPDLDKDLAFLDLATGSLIKPRENSARWVLSLKGGDIGYDATSLIALRRGMVSQWDGETIRPLESDYEESVNANIFHLPSIPCRLLVAISDDRLFEVKALRETEQEGLAIEYQQVTDSDAGLLSALRYQHSRDGATLLRALSLNLRPGDTMDKVQGLLGTGTQPEKQAELMEGMRRVAAKIPANYPEGVNDTDVLLGYPFGQTTLYLQFRDGKLINFNPEEFAEAAESTAPGEAPRR